MTSNILEHPIYYSKLKLRNDNNYCNVFNEFVLIREIISIGGYNSNPTLQRLVGFNNLNFIVREELFYKKLMPLRIKRVSCE